MEPYEIAFKDTECIARALVITMQGDDVEWKSFVTKAIDFQEALKRVKKDEMLLDLHRSMRR